MLLEIEGSSGYSCSVEGGHGNVIVVENGPLEDLLFDRNNIGAAFSETCLQATRYFVRHIGDELESDWSEVSELIILSKGLTYQIERAVVEEFGVALPVNLVATRRAAVSGTTASVECLYTQFDAGGSTLIIGDTVASGATVVAALNVYRRRHELRKLFLLSYAGATVGAIRVIRYCREAGVELRILFGLAAFGLGENGFDLSFLHPETVTRDIYKERATAQFAGQPVSAVGWDFGSQVFAPRKYGELCWMEAERWGLHGQSAFALEVQPVSLETLAAEASAWRSTDRG